MDTERNLTVGLQNIKMVNRMEEIYFGKEAEKYPGGPPTIKKVRDNIDKSPVGSLNYFTRKKDSQRILDANEKLYARLKNSSPIVRKSDHEKAFD